MIRCDQARNVAQLVAAVLLGISTCAALAADTAGQKPVALKHNPVYSRYCAMCHGRNGNGGGFAPSFKPRRSDADTSAVRQRYLNAVMHGRRGMPSFSGRLSDADMASVIDAVLEVRLGAAHQRVTAKEIEVLRQR